MLIIVILVNPVSGMLKKNESRYIPGNRLQEKQIITKRILPEKYKCVLYICLLLPLFMSWDISINIVAYHGLDDQDQMWGPPSIQWYHRLSLSLSLSGDKAARA
jgi:hypothetical protein